MMKWFFRWWIRNCQRVGEDGHKEQMIANQGIMSRQFDGGLQFQLVEAENGKILKVMSPDPSGGMAAPMNTRRRGGFMNPHTGMEEKLYVIADGENVMEFITRALVEERIK